jgi:hypothetical protein
MALVCHDDAGPNRSLAAVKVWLRVTMDRRRTGSNSAASLASTEVWKARRS